MDFGDLIFYGILAISVISSVAKAIKKKPDAQTDGDPETGMPDFKGSRPGDIFKKLIEEMQDKEDDYIPSNPKPVLQTVVQSEKQPVQKLQVVKQKVEPLKRPDLASNYYKNRFVTENMPRREYFKSHVYDAPETVHAIESDPILKNLDLYQMDELKKGIIYSEILRPKF